MHHRFRFCFYYMAAGTTVNMIGIVYGNDTISHILLFILIV